MCSTTSGWNLFSCSAQVRKICNNVSKQQTFIWLQYDCRQPESESVSCWLCLFVRGDWGRSDQGHNSALATFKRQEGQVMTQQTTLAWLTCYILSAGVNEFSVRVCVSRCLPALQMASMLLPSSTCCSLVTLPLLWLSALPLQTPKTSHPVSLSAGQASFHSSLVEQSWHVHLKCLVHTGDSFVCGNKMRLCSRDTAQHLPMKFLHCTYMFSFWFFPDTW